MNRDKEKSKMQVKTKTQVTIADLLHLDKPTKETEKVNINIKEKIKQKETKASKEPKESKESRERKITDPKIQLDTYKLVSERNNYNWSLPDRDAINLFISNCFLCNSKPAIQLTQVDTFDDSTNYTLSNSYPCCKSCMRIKNRFKPKNFIKRCIHIATYNKMYDGALYAEELELKVTNNLTTCRSKAKKQNVEFNLNVEQFASLTKNRCYMCNKVNDVKSKNNLEMINNKLGYTVNNCKSICNNCIIMKGVLDEDAFLERCLLVAKHSQVTLK
jgi:hypothetical protein